MTLPFLVISPLHVGEGRLVPILRSHPDIAMGGELFGVQDPSVIQFPYLREEAALVELRKTNTVEFLRALYERCHDRGAQAFGYRISYEQMRATPRIEGYMPTVPDLRVVHVWRDNLLARLAARERSRRGGDGPVELTMDECAADFVEVEQNREWARRTFAHRPILELSHSDLMTDPLGAGARIVDFLGLYPCELSGAEPEPEEPLRSMIANYDGLRQELADWDGWFDD